MELITDRTFADVERVIEFAKRGWHNLTIEEQNEWLSGMKGAYNYTDLNRVESAVLFLAETLNLRAPTKTDWTVVDIPTQEDITRFLGNIQLLKDSLGVKTHDVPKTLDGMNFETANTIELILEDLTGFVGGWNRCGDMYCGEA